MWARGCADVLLGFSQACYLTKVPALFGFDAHPAVPRTGREPWPMRVLLGKIIYGCNLVDMFRSMKTEAKRDARAKTQKTRDVAKVIAEGESGHRSGDGGVVYNSVLVRAMSSHLADILQPKTIFSAVAGNFAVRALDETLAEPRSKRQTLLEHDGHEVQEIDVGDGQCSRSSTNYFEVVWKRLGAKKTVPVAPGAGSKPTAASIAVSIAKTITNRNNSEYVVVSTVYNRDDSGSVFILSDIVGEIEDLQSTTIMWKTTPQWTLSDGIMGIGIEQCRDNLSDVVSDLVAAQAYPGSLDTLGCTVPAEYQQTLGVLLGEGLVRCTPSGRWFLIERGW